MAGRRPGTVNADGSAELRELDSFDHVADLPLGTVACAVSPDREWILLNPVEEGDAVVARIGAWEDSVRIHEGGLMYADFDPTGELLSIDGVRYSADGKSILLIAVSGVDATLARIDADTGETLVALSDQFSEWPATPLIDIEAGLVGSLNADGTAMLRDLETFTPIVSLPEGYFALAVTNDGTRVLMSSLDFSEAMVAEVGSWETVTKLEPSPVCFGDFNPGGDLLSAYNCQTLGLNGLIDVESGSIVAGFHALETDWTGEVFSPDGSFLAMRDFSGRFGLLDIAVLDSGGTLEDAWVFDPIDAHDGAIPDNVDFSSDETLAATWGLVDRHLRVWHTEDGRLSADLGETSAVAGFDFHPNGRHLIVEGANGTLRVYTLDTTELIDIARSRVTRSFTDDECANYRIDPCPTLEAIRDGS